jgi:hypothetical protein
VCADDPRPADMVLLVGLPIGTRRNFSTLHEDSALDKPFTLTALNQWGKDGECPMLIGVRKFDYDPEGIRFRTWFSIERLKFPYLLKTESNIAKATIRQRAALCSDTRFVTGFGVEYRELMLRSERRKRRSIDQRRDDIVERGPQVVYDVADDGSEHIFRTIVRANEGITPTVFIHFGNPKGVSVTVINGRLALLAEALQSVRAPVRPLPRTRRDIDSTPCYDAFSFFLGQAAPSELWPL